MEQADATLRIKTEPVAVRVFTTGFEIEGNAHTKPGGYWSRVSDILNVGKLNFLAITEARYRRRDSKDNFAESACLIVNLKDVELVDLVEAE